MVPTKNILRKFNLHSVCEESRCPNMSECFRNKTATFLILGNICTRNCSFCNIKKGTPAPVDYDEPLRILQAVEELKINYLIITSVTRDDLLDGGAEIFVNLINLFKKNFEDKKIEVLIPDFQGKENSLKSVVESKPDILAHNIETVPSLYPFVRSKGNYKKSLTLLEKAKKMSRNQLTKSGLMLGLGEKEEEVLSVMKDISSTGCNFLSIGQYLAPDKKSFRVSRYLSSEEFLFYAERGKEIGFKHIESGRYVRTSYNAHKYLESQL
jgi:lipoic acid synthetase